MWFCHFNSVCVLPRDNQYVKSPYRILVFLLMQKRCACFPPLQPQVTCMSLTSCCMHKEGHMAGHNHSLGGYHERSEVQTRLGHRCTIKGANKDAEVSFTPVNLRDVTFHRDPWARAFSHTESIAAAFGLVKPWDSSSSSVCQRHYEIWEMSPFAFTYTNICPYGPLSGTMQCLEYWPSNP